MEAQKQKYSASLSYKVFASYQTLYVLSPAPSWPGAFCPAGRGRVTLSSLKGPLPPF